MPHVSGPRISGSHTTVIEQSEPIVNFLQKVPKVSKITPGNIDNNAGSGRSGVKRIKIIDKDRCIKIAVSGNSSNQDLWVYLESSDYRQKIKTLLERFAREEAYDVSKLDATT